jgi:hypothetical protein
MAIDLTVRTREGRPTALTPEIADIIYNHVADGNYPGTACMAAGLDESTIYKWRNKAALYKQWLDDNDIYSTDVNELPEHDNGLIYYQFFIRLKTAESLAEIAHVNNLKRAGSAGPQFWAASATYLERKHPDRWAKRDAIDISVKDSQVLLEKLAKALKSGE